MNSSLTSQPEGTFLLDAVTELMTTLDLKLRIRWANRTAGESINKDPENLVGRYCYQVWHGREFPCESCPVLDTIKTGESQESEMESPDGRHWHVRSYPLRSADGQMDSVAAVVQEIPQTRKAEEEYKRIEWLFKPGKGSQEAPPPEYGNLQKLNTSRVILDGVGEEVLSSIVKDFLDLLETSVAIYEANGDYALGIFSSKWCRFMDLSSRRLCSTGDNREALTCGKWLCHESCWSTAQECMEQGKPIDRECAGGIRLYAIPIHSRDKIIGAISSGYGDPPQDRSILKALAGRYHVDVKELTRYANTYESRPPFLVENAKRRMETAARLIGEIVERKQTEEALRTQEKNLHQTLQSIGDAVIATDTQGNVARMNPVAESLTGWSLQEAQGKPLTKVFRIINAFTRELCTDPVQMVLTTGEVQGLANHTVLLAQDGQEYQIADSASPIRDDQGQIEGVVLVFRDVTENYRQQEALRQSEERFQNMLSLIPDMVSIHDPDMNILYSNWNGFAAVPPEKRILNTKCFKTYRGFDRICPDCRAVKALETREAFAEETMLPDGRWADLRIIPVLDQDSNVQFFVEWVRDVTQQKHIEEALRESEEKYRQLFQSSPISLCEQDFSEIKRRIDELKSQGIKDLHSYFLEHPDLVWELAGLVKTLDVNQQAVDLFKAGSKDELLSGMTKIFGKEFHKIFAANALLVIARGEKDFVTERDHVTLDG
ncbi:MAG: PAS domain-containing protein, partial [Desulfovermiculus sp.]